MISYTKWSEDLREQFQIGVLTTFHCVAVQLTSVELEVGDDIMMSSPMLRRCHYTVYDYGRTQPNSIDF